MTPWAPVLVLLGVTVAGLTAVYGAAAWLTAGRGPWPATSFSGGLPAREHAFSRYHARWYPISMIFLAFDMEMLFMYPWVRVVSEMGVSAVVEMFVFLGILMAGVTYAYREGAFGWT